MPKSHKKQIRSRFREAVFKRDRFTCQVCGRVWRPEDTDPSLGRVNAHHITDRSAMPNGGYVVENGITVCDGGDGSCHMRCEQYHITEGRHVEQGLHPDELYAKVGSSWQTAYKASQCLS